MSQNGNFLSPEFFSEHSPAMDTTETRRRSSSIARIAEGGLLTPPISFSGLSSFTTYDQQGPNETSSLLDDSYGGDVRDTLTSTGETLFNTVNAVVGVGILSLPYALKQSGWIVGIGLLIGLLMATNYTGKLLKRCMQHSPGIQGYPEIGFVAFGRRGKIVITLFLFFELFTACCMFLILAADHLKLLFPELHTNQLLLFSALCVLPTTFMRNMKFLSFFSLLGIISTVWVLFTVIISGFANNHPKTTNINVTKIASNISTTILNAASTMAKEPSLLTGLRDEDPQVLELGGSILHPQPTHLFTSFNDTMITYGLIMVGFAGHAVMPTIYQGMSNPRDYVKVLNISWIVLGFVYTSIAVSGYLMYGDHCADEITKNMFATSDGSTIMRITTILIVLNPLTKFALTLSPVALSIEELLSQRVNAKSSTFIVGLLINRTVLVAIVLGVAIAVPNFAKIVGFIGSVFSFTVSIFFPCAAYLKLFHKELSWSSFIINWALVLSSVAMGTMGTIGAMMK